MVSSRDSILDQKKNNTENFVKELLEALAEIMDKKVHLQNENVELKHKCQSQRQKIEAFKELALGEKAFLLGIIRKECCAGCTGPQSGEDIEKRSKPTETEVEEETNPMTEIKNLQRIIQQQLEASKAKEEALMASMRNLESQLSQVQKRCDGLQNQLNDLQVEQKVKHKSKKDSKNGDKTSVSSKIDDRDSQTETAAPKKACKCGGNPGLQKFEEKDSQTETNVPKKVCRCGGGVISQKEEDILNELFFQRF